MDPASTYPRATDPSGEAIRARPRSDRENASLQALRQDVNDDLVVDHFVAVFLELLDERLLSIWRLLGDRRIEDSVTALLSIETSSLMVGANDLAASAATLRRVVGTNDDRRIPTLYDDLLAAGERAKIMLSRPDDA